MRSKNSASLTNTFDAEYGRNSGSVVNVVTKSGTNKIHGDFYEFLRNNALNTARLFRSEARHPPDYKQNQFGATLGGPIKKDKLSSSAPTKATDWSRAYFSSGTVFLPSAQEAAGNFGGSFLGNINDQNFAQARRATAFRCAPACL